MKYFVGIIVAVLVVLLAWSIGYKYYSGTLEEPGYEVVEKYDGFEVRDYDSYIVAQVEVDTDGRAGVNEGFRVLADYIFGNNISVSGLEEGKEFEEVAMTVPVTETVSLESVAESIAMTAPVTDFVEGDKRVIIFSMPSKYTLENLPKPVNDRVELVEVPAGKFAVKTVSGNGTRSKMEKALSELRAELEKEEISYNMESYSFAYFDPPLTPWFLKRNEVLVELT